MKQVYVQTDSEGVEPLSHDYDLEDGFIFTTLTYSNNSEWADDIRGTIAGTIQDDGNGVTIKMEGIKKLELDYGQAQRLLILLLSNNSEKIEIRESKLIKSV